MPEVHINNSKAKENKSIPTFNVLNSLTCSSFLGIQPKLTEVQNRERKRLTRHPDI